MANRSGWNQHNLDEVFWFQEGPGVRKWQFMDSGIKLLNVANIEKSRTLNLTKTDRHLNLKEVEERYSHFLLDAGDLVIASSGISFDDDGMLRTRGAFVEERHLPLCLNTSTIRFKAKPEVSNLGYLQHWLDSREFREQITKRVTGSAQQNFGPSHLKAIKITLPPLPEQRRIAAILDQADALRAKRREALAQLDSLTLSIFIEMFGDPGANLKRWPIDTLSEIIAGKPNNGIFRKNEDYGNGLPVIWIEELFRGNWIDTSKSRRLKPTPDEREKYGLNDGDILFCRSSLKLAGVGFNNVYFGGPKEALFECHVIRISPDKDKIDPLFMNFALRMPNQRQKLFKHAKTVTMSTIDQDGLLRLELPIPPLALQREFSKRLRAIEDVKISHGRSLVELDTLFASLQHRAFRGEL
jgi:type I restriction enzyme S subunit